MLTLSNSGTRDTLNILFIAAEAHPFVKIGGLGDVAGSLPRALKDIGCIQSNDPKLDIRLAIPFYGVLHKPDFFPKKVASYSLDSLEGAVTVEVFETESQGIPVYLIAGKSISPDSPVYGSNFEKDAEKFIFFSLACLYLPLELNWPVDILHANDWHTAIAVHELRNKRKNYPQLSRVKSILTVHNLPFMGSGSEKALKKFMIAPARNPRMPKWARSLPLPMGLNAADRIVAVSPTYAKEIQEPGYGCDLQNFLKTKAARITGILNGIDANLWDPQQDQLITQLFSKDSLENRTVNKKSLQDEFRFKTDSEIPLLTFIGRMDPQKGVDLVITSLKTLRHLPWQIIFLGTGDKQLELSLLQLQSEFPEKVRAILRFDSPLSHRLYASADMLLMPSRYEPCGLAQIIAMRYGCIPVARATGGLNDTILDVQDNPNTGTGFLSAEVDAIVFAKSVKSALSVFQKKNRWQAIQLTAMSQDFSWQKSAKQYLKIYQELV